MEKIKESVKRNIVINAPINKVWEALTKPEHLNRWYSKSANIDFRVGGYGEMDHGWGAKTLGVFTEIIHCEKFVLKSPDGDFTTITSVQEEENGTRVTIEYIANFFGDEGLAAEENMLFGTYQFLKNLKSVLESNIDLRPQFWKTSIGIIHTSYNDSGVQGSRVIKVQRGSAAESAGILQGDIILQADNQTVYNYESLETELNKQSVNSVVLLNILRNGKTCSVRCKIDPYPVPY